MQKSFLVVIMLVFNSVIFGQTLQVLNETNLEPIADVLVYSTSEFESASTNSRGKLDASVFNTDDILTFQHPSYQQRTATFKEISDKNFKIYLAEKVIQIDEVVISANKWEQDKSEIANEITAIGPRQVEFNNPQTAADLLEASGQVFVQKSQLGGGSPMMRGFAANSVLIVLDGIRMNNAIFRGGNLQNLIQVDPNVLEGAEVVFGPGSVIYGSDALGGVMDFHTLDPEFSSDNKPLIFGQAFTRYSSANNEKTGHVHLNIGGKKFSSLSSFSVSDYDDLRTGSNRTDEFPDFGKREQFVQRENGADVIKENKDENVQKFSGYWQYNFLQKFKWRLSDFSDIQYQFYYTTSSDVPRYDRLIEERNGEPRSAEWYYGPQRFLMNSLKLNYFRKNALFDQGRLTFSYQDFEESRHDRDFQSDILRHRTENLDIITLNLDFDKVINQSHQLFYGVEYTNNDVVSTANQENIETGEVTPTSTRYPSGGNKYETFAAYLSHKWNIKENLILSSGVRYSHVTLNSTFENDSFFNFPFDKLDIKNGSLNGSTGLVFKPSDKVKLNALFSTGFRSPNVDDAGKIFDSEPGNVVVPNGDLNPEYTYNFELGAKKRFAETVELGITGFYTILNDAIVRRDFEFNGQDSIVYDGVLSRVQAEVNVGEAHIYGFSLSLNSDLSEHFSLSSSLTFTDGEDKIENVPLRHTTPLFGQTSLTYAAKKIKAELFARYNGKRSFADLAPSEQNKTHLYTADGSLAWGTLNIRGSYQITRHLQINGGIENIFDKHYRPYSSGISAPGRNFIVALRSNF
ncbi:MAG: TonB-dependent receptor [Cyclobacteriaceae bacterium]